MLVLFIFYTFENILRLKLCTIDLGFDRWRLIYKEITRPTYFFYTDLIKFLYIVHKDHLNLYFIFGRHLLSKSTSYRLHS
jgi:hypothetical protein